MKDQCAQWQWENGPGWDVLQQSPLPTVTGGVGHTLADRHDFRLVSGHESLQVQVGIFTDSCPGIFTGLYMPTENHWFFNNIMTLR